jgi:hypothetical protein
MKSSFFDQCVFYYSLARREKVRSKICTRNWFSFEENGRHLKRSK